MKKEEEQDFKPHTQDPHINIIDTFEISEKTKFAAGRVWKRHYGNNYVCLFWRGEPLLTLGPHWYMNICMFITLSITSYFLLNFTAHRGRIYVFEASLFISFIQLASYTLCALVNPGIVSAKLDPIDKDMLVCEVCLTSTQEEYTYHCEDCDVCIEGYDHHCPWTGKCIGRRNLYFFYCFIVMVPLNIIFIITVVIIN